MEHVFWGKAYNKSKKCIIDLVYITDKYIHKELKLDYTRNLIFLSYWSHILKLSAYTKISATFFRML
ncbi:hypothetical protein H740_10065 [Campylobacter showae CC57C]|uniref:Uncharacterized protein n=1 Tax=Campylobacter showae CC57C TaxID=1073353 RepID=M3GWF3_9BACT|nr:hypothetical protein H740_10065 [Campylobacter showae CC57C]